MYIADMQLIGTSENPFSYCVTARQNQIVFGNIQLLDRQRHKRQIFLITGLGLGQILNKGCLGMLATKLGARLIT
ncbi:hypothetical protein D3C81_2229330 [compost metagenome]